MLWFTGLLKRTDSNEFKIDYDFGGVELCKLDLMKTKEKFNEKISRQRTPWQLAEMAARVTLSGPSRKV